MHSYTQSIKKSKASKTKFGKNIYSNLWYVDNINKVCFTFTPRGGCSISFQQYLDLIGLLNDALKYDLFVHKYRCDIFDKNIPYVHINKLVHSKYIFIKFIMNPYIRAVSIFRVQTSHNLSFRQYLKQLVNNEISYFNDNDKYHLHPQYIEGEEHIITKYIVINEYEKYMIKLYNNTNYEIDVNKYTSNHHGIKSSCNDFLGDVALNEVNEKLPISYKFFYDNEIKNLVDIYYKKDIEKYNFSFNF